MCRGLCSMAEWEAARLIYLCRLGKTFCLERNIPKLVLYIEHFNCLSLFGNIFNICWKEIDFIFIFFYWMYINNKKSGQKQLQDCDPHNMQSSQSISLFHILSHLPSINQPFRQVHTFTLSLANHFLIVAITYCNRRVAPLFTNRIHNSTNISYTICGTIYKHPICMSNTLRLRFIACIIWYHFTVGQVIIADNRNFRN